MDRKNYIAFFDIDDTIIRINSTKVLVYAARKSGLMSTLDFAKALFHVILYRLKLKETLKIVHKMGSWTAGIKEETFNKMVEEMNKTIIIDAIRPEIINEIKFHKENNAEIAILSSAISAISYPLANFLGIDHVLCSELETENGRFTGRPVGKFCFGEEKLVRLKEYCAIKNYQINEAYYYGDSIDDLPVLQQVGFPVCVTPDKKLISFATLNEWIVHQW